MTAQELKTAFFTNFINEWEAKMATASDRVRRAQTKPRPDGAWDAHMKSVVTGKINEEPASGGVEPEYAEGGSSPRTWGTPGFRVVERAGDRFIPTHVGNTTAGASSRRPAAVHPHARGEHVP